MRFKYILQSNVKPFSSCHNLIYILYSRCRLYYGSWILWDYHCFRCACLCVTILLQCSPQNLHSYKNKKNTYYMTPVPKVFEFVDQRYITPLNISITTLLYRETEYITITYAIKSYFIYDFIVSVKLWYCHRISELLPKYSKYLTGSNTI